jgi:regulator of replication initiation timing
MNLNTIIIIIVSAIVTGAVSLIGFLIKKAIFEKLSQVENKLSLMDSKIDKIRSDMEIKLNKLQSDIVNLQLTLVDNYVNKKDFSENTTAHKELWIEINHIKDTSIPNILQRVSKLEK